MSILPEWITGNIRRMAQTFIERGARAGLEPFRIIETLRSEGLTYRTADMYRDIRYWRELAERGSPMKYITRSAVPSMRWYMENPKALGARFMTRVRIDLVNTITGETKSRFPWVYHTHMEAGVETPDTALTKTRAEIEEAAVRAVMSPEGTRPESEEWQVVRTMPMYGFYNPYW